MSEPLLEIRGLRTRFDTRAGIAHAIDGVDITVRSGKTVCLVGESGCGKTVTALSVLGLLPANAQISGGAVRFRGRDLLSLPERELRAVRGNEIAMVFQEPLTALNPVLTVGEQIAEVLRQHLGFDKAAARQRASEVLDLVGIPDPATRVDSYPHQLSGGMRQRVMIAMAVACDPALLIADEPTTALDVTVQAQILDLFRQLQERLGMALLLITHDLGVVAETADEVYVLYAGRVVERAGVEELFARPRHPYTIGLLRSLPDFAAPGEPLPSIPGTVPSPFQQPSGCRYRLRCPLAREECVRLEPALDSEVDHAAACHFLEEASRL